MSAEHASNPALKMMPNEHAASRVSIGPAQSAQYTTEMLESLKKIALRQNQRLLAHLLDLAAIEAKSLVVSQDHETLFPG